MQELKITFVRQHFIENKIDIDSYKKAINSAFHGIDHADTNSYLRTR